MSDARRLTSTLPCLTRGGILCHRSMCAKSKCRRALRGTRLDLDRRARSTNNGNKDGRLWALVGFQLRCYARNFQRAGGRRSALLIHCLCDVGAGVGHIGDGRGGSTSYDEAKIARRLRRVYDHSCDGSLVPLALRARDVVSLADVFGSRYETVLIVPLTVPVAPMSLRIRKLY